MCQEFIPRDICPCMIIDEPFCVMKVWIWSLRLNIIINSRSCQCGKLDESFDIISISMLKSLKIIVEHEGVAIMMNLSYISNDLVREVE